MTTPVTSTSACGRSVTPEASGVVPVGWFNPFDPIGSGYA
jgi:hypothetical protein